jgi:hypothetical protein
LSLHFELCIGLGTVTQEAIIAADVIVIRISLIPSTIPQLAAPEYSIAL